jgi:hypothetical protein
VRRAAIIIGVDRAGNLPVLHDAAAGARRFEKWAREQGVESIDVLTDENGGEVGVDAVKKAINRIVRAGTTEQLIVYFAGHGVNINYNEYWLLSDAPADSNAAVNVRGSEDRARYAGIPHVLFISDACRTAAQGINAQGTTGSEIFRNDVAGDTQNPVDQFFACTLGRPALEVPDKTTTAREFKALYTGALLDGLRGAPPVELEWRSDGAERIGLVHPRPLRDYLKAEVPRRLAALDLQTKAIQVPDARINSDPPAWVARLAGAAGEAERTAGAGVSEAPPTPAAGAASLLRAALAEGHQAPAAVVAAVDTAQLEAATGIVDAFVRTSAPFGPMHHESQCGIKVRGAKIANAFSKLAQLTLFEQPGEVVRVDQVDPPGAGVLLVFESGAGAVVPAIPEFLATLTVEDGELIDVAYEPSDNSWRWGEFAPRAMEIRALRAVASASTRSGVFRLEGDDALSVARRMQIAKGLDPTLAIYAAYAYNDMQRRDLIREMSGYMRGDLGARLFDIALLAGELDDTKIGNDRELLSFMPLLAQGWALLGARRVRLPKALEDLRAMLLPSVWTLLDERGTERVRAAMQNGEVR